MLTKLHALLRGPLRDMLADPAYPWKTLDVTYDVPRVERIWTQWGEDRVSLHRLHPCENPLFHPHPWPSAMVILSGQYLMGLGRSLDGSTPVETARIKLTPGAQYEMLDQLGWHWVKPLDLPVMSVMVSGKPWKMPDNYPIYGKGASPDELRPEVRDEMLGWFRHELGVFPC